MGTAKSLRRIKSSEHQSRRRGTPEKLQIPNCIRAYWSLVLGVSLELGIWSFLVFLWTLGAWDLELSSSAPLQIIHFTMLFMGGVQAAQFELHSTIQNGRAHPTAGFAF